MFESDRREFIRALLGGAAGLTWAWPASAQGQGGPAPIVATKITERYAVLSGAGGNVGVIIGNDGVMMIDGGTANRAGDLAMALATVSPRMVQVLFNTHYHFDHVGSNELLGGRVRIIAHENVKKRLGVTFENPAMGRRMDALPTAAQPTETFTAGGRLSFGQDQIEYTYTPLAHTDGDAFVFLPGMNLLQTGDLLWVGRYPVIDYSVGGSLARMAEVLGQLDGVGDSNTKIIPGHGGPAGVTKADMRQTREIWLAINQSLEDHAKQGRPVEEVLASGPTKDFDSRVGSSMPDGFLRQAYGGVLARQGSR
jgi:glyoxylase-like metal-dependent hydrolase (beta-lactamase superfamily II)